VSEHVVPVKVYVGIFLALLVLTWLTVAVASFDLGALALGGLSLPLNFAAALTIAVCKATLVVLYFMHARYGGALVRIVVVAGVVWLFILLLLTLADYASRGWLGYPGT
jgi:cytochrome c oxidase subunit 4